MDKNQDKTKYLLSLGLATPSVPADLEQKIIFAVHKQQRLSALRTYRLWVSGLFSSVTAILLGIAWSIQSLNTDGAMEIIKAAIANFSILRFSDMFWGIMENLPLNGLALIFCAITILGILTSTRKINRSSILSLQHT